MTFSVNPIIGKAWRAKVEGDVKIKIVLLAIASSATAQTEAAITQRSLSELTGLSLRDIDDATTWLDNEGYIRTMSRLPGSFQDAVFIVQLLLGDWR